ncbi:DUF5076 domain-containing protein [Sphingomonas sp. SUN019]|uniref:DUF5076 domain-containing protein n=1 Tax=Sphingomonas sp. SUN019 TaxID=2937788 RepID=UPI00216404AE|nr:DUF5076 domain-containing protein [Sphingomonas sp. SUN019]UVO52335.1 DUF5076 domain-containing protein [Sphingomonas sp. SUN019]
MSRDKPGAIDLPDGLLTDQSAEVARIWVTNNAGSTVLIDAEVLADPEVFGYLLADTARHAAKAYAQAGNLDEDASLQAIVDGLGKELREQFNTITPTKRSN